MRDWLAAIELFFSCATAYCFWQDFRSGLKSKPRTERGADLVLSVITVWLTAVLWAHFWENGPVRW